MRQVITLTDKFDPNDPQDLFDRFDKISQDFGRIQGGQEDKPAFTDELKNKETVDQEKRSKEEKKKSSPSPGRKTRMERLNESKPRKILGRDSTQHSTTTNLTEEQLPKSKLSASQQQHTAENTEVQMTKRKKKRKKRYTINKKKLLKTAILLCLIVGLTLGGVVTAIVVTAPTIHPDEIGSLLAESSVLYDDSEEILDNLWTQDGMRTNVSYTQLPDHLVDAFVAIEDKTFWSHNGFNVVRILGAIKEKVFQGGAIRGTSTLTQQLARNLFLTEDKSKYSMVRKIREAYYSVVLERELSKEQIAESYLNTIFLGFNSCGVQAASQAYFSKDVSELTLLESAALASLPKAPDRYALIKRYDSVDVAPDDERILRRGDVYTLVYNDAVVDRTHLVLKFMLEQKMINEAEYQEAMNADLRASLNPSEENLHDLSSYFTDYAIKEVVQDLMSTLNISETEARNRIYNGGLRIHTTLSMNMQKIAEKEFSENTNFPKVSKPKKDGAGNLINAKGAILLYSYNNYFDSTGTFFLHDDEYAHTADGGILLYQGKRLTFPKTEFQGEVDHNIEFKEMYLDDGTFYVIKGGNLHVPKGYKTKDADGNLIISGKFFTDNPNFFQGVSGGLKVDNTHYTLKQKVVQPQAAMVIFDYHNGGIKAMVGGRNLEGKLLFNRAIKPRPPGSSIKPIGVYGPALQSGVDKAKSGIKNSAVDGTAYGALWTAASVIDDAPMTVNGKTWPKNWYTGFRGPQTMRKSIEQSVNVNAVKVFREIEPKTSVDFLKNVGISTLVETGNVNDMNPAALALGGMSYGVPPLEMAAAYGAFANQGIYTAPTAYTKVTTKRGDVLLEKKVDQHQAMDPGVAFIMTDMLRSTVVNGIAKQAAIGTQPVAGKTGTTSDNYDAWFVGFTPQYSAAVWIGNDINIQLSQGSVAASRVWSKVMKQAHAGIPAARFPTASNVISVSVDGASGRLPSAYSTVISEYFVKGTEPTTVDTTSTPLYVCSANEERYFVTPSCPHPIAKAPGSFSTSGNESDDKPPMPIYYCNIHNPDPTLYPTDPSAPPPPPEEGWNEHEEGGITPIPSPETGNGGNESPEGGNGNGGAPSPEEQIPEWIHNFDVNN